MLAAWAALPANQAAAWAAGCRRGAPGSAALLEGAHGLLVCSWWCCRVAVEGIRGASLAGSTAALGGLGAGSAVGWRRSGLAGSAGEERESWVARCWRSVGGCKETRQSWAGPAGDAQGGRVVVVCVNRSGGGSCSANGEMERGVS